MGLSALMINVIDDGFIQNHFILHSFIVIFWGIVRWVIAETGINDKCCR
jgi:hypothetical protein